MSSWWCFSSGYCGAGVLEFAPRWCKFAGVFPAFVCWVVRFDGVSCVRLQHSPFLRIWAFPSLVVWGWFFRPVSSLLLFFLAFISPLASLPPFHPPSPLPHLPICRPSLLPFFLSSMLRLANVSFFLYGFGSWGMALAQGFVVHSTLETKLGSVALSVEPRGAALQANVGTPLDAQLDCVARASTGRTSTRRLWRAGFAVARYSHLSLP